MPDDTMVRVFERALTRQGDALDRVVFGLGRIDERAGERHETLMSALRLHEERAGERHTARMASDRQELDALTRVLAEHPPITPASMRDALRDGASGWWAVVRSPYLAIAVLVLAVVALAVVQAFRESPAETARALRGPLGKIEIQHTDNRQEVTP
ncbi:MAG: hypothetical protein ABIH03_17405 [Pseudomonadota bacterium]